MVITVKIEDINTQRLETIIKRFHTFYVDAKKDVDDNTKGYHSEYDFTYMQNCLSEYNKYKLLLEYYNDNIAESFQFTPEEY